MKGHLGFRCRTCLPPGVPRNLRQVGVGSVSGTYSATLAWDPPLFSGSGPVLGYLVEKATDTSMSSWEIVGETSSTQLGLSWCLEGGNFRVSAKNRCGFGQSSSFGSWLFSYSGSVSMLTSSSIVFPPCWALQVTFWCVGCGGTFSGGGGGGGLAVKNWSRTLSQSWSGPFYCVVRNTADSNGPALASVSYGGTTAIGYGGSASEVGYAVGGDSNFYGNPGGDSYQTYGGDYGGSISYPFTGTTQYSGPYKFGGGVGGAIGTRPDGSLIRPSPVSRCMRHPAAGSADLMTPVSLLGMRVVEECNAEAAFGSGGVTFAVPSYGGSTRVNFSPGYGGGGFDSTTPGGPGCILVRYA